MVSSDQRRRASGFTLIELLIIVLVIGILASIAIPQYFRMVEKGKTVEATGLFPTNAGVFDATLQSFHR